MKPANESLRLFVIRDREQGGAIVAKDGVALYSHDRLVMKHLRDTMNSAATPADGGNLFQPRYYLSPGPDHRKWNGDKV